MAEATARPSVVPIEIRPSLALHMSAWAWGALVAGVLMLGALAFHGLSGSFAAAAPGADLGFATRVAVVASLTTGYTLAVWRWSAVLQVRDFVELGLLPDIDADTTSVHAVSAEQLRGSRLAGLIGVAFFVAIVEVPGAISGAPFGVAWTGLHSLSYMLFLGVVFFWTAGRAAYFSIGRSRYRQVLEGLEVDVLDRRPLRVFGRLGLRSALVWVIGISISMFAFVNPELRVEGSLVVLIPLLVVSLGIALAAMLLPLRGLRERIVLAKQTELTHVEAAILGDTAALARTRIALRDPPPGLADLIAYKALVEAAPETPFDGSTLRRLGLYTLIPLASWVGGALVERGVSAVLD